MTLKTSKLPDGDTKVWLTAEEKARERGLPWPLDPDRRPTLCFLGLGPRSASYLVSLARFFPELRLVLLDVEEEAWAPYVEELLSRPGRIERGQVEEFAETRGPERRTCQAISWSVDTPPFSFFGYRELFYSSPYILALFNLEGCSEETKSDEVDGYYCEYLFQSFQQTICGKINDRKAAEMHGEELFFPMVDAGCGESICMCHAHSDAFLDFHFEHLCREGDHRFMGQWGQDQFLLSNVFRRDSLQGRGVYVDVGASHAFHLSNTAYFDHCLNWQGVCVEPNPRSKPILQALRTCKVWSGCAWANTTSMKFGNEGELATRTDDATLLASDPWSANVTSGVGTYFEATCSPLHNILLETFPHLQYRGNPPVIDLISVDAEGAEIEIFRNFPFEAWDIRAVVVEISRQTSMAIDSLLLPRGFLKAAVLGKDAVYVHQKMAVLLPPDGPLLPERIQWNEPGTDSDTIDYMRFQRLFGVEGDLDDEVGDPRLQNESELARQWGRTEAKSEQNKATFLQGAAENSVGGLLSDVQREAMELPWVQEALKDPATKAALNLLVNDEAAFLRLLRGDERLRKKVAALVDVGLVTRPSALMAVGSR